MAKQSMAAERVETRVSSRFVEPDALKGALVVVAGWDPSQDGDPDYEEIIDNILCDSDVLDRPLRQVLLGKLHARVESMEEELAAMGESVRGEEEVDEGDGEGTSLRDRIDSANDLIDQLEA